MGDRISTSTDTNPSNTRDGTPRPPLAAAEKDVAKEYVGERDRAFPPHPEKESTDKEVQKITFSQILLQKVSTSFEEASTQSALSPQLHVPRGRYCVQTADQTAHPDRQPTTSVPHESCKINQPFSPLPPRRPAALPYLPPSEAVIVISTGLSEAGCPGKSTVHAVALGSAVPPLVGWLAAVTAAPVRGSLKLAVTPT